MRKSARSLNPVVDAFGLPKTPTLTTRNLEKARVSVSEIRCDRPNFGLTSSMPREEGYLIGLQLRACPGHDLYFDGRLTRPRNFRAGMTCIYDLRRDPVADLRDPFHSLHVHLPQAALDEVSDQESIPRISNLDYKLGIAIDDPVVLSLLQALMPSLANPRSASAIFIDHVAAALAVHVATTYGKVELSATEFRGGLSRRDEIRTKELLIANMDGEITLRELARECGLSERHFARAFKLSTGDPPFRWLAKMRLARAKELLTKTSLSLSEIAMTCGYSDQSHFTRAFFDSTGVPPGAWRRMQR